MHADSQARDAGDRESDRRSHQRRTLSELAGLDRVRLKYGPSVTVLDLSPGGALIEVDGYRLQPNATIVMELLLDGRNVAVPARVLRSQVSRFSPRPIYRGGLLFKHPIDLPAAGGPEAGEAEVLREYDSLDRALARRSGGADPLTSVGSGALGAAVALIAAADKEPGRAPLALELGRLIRTITVAIDRLDRPELVLDRIVESVRTTVPVSAARLVEGSVLDRLVARAPVYFDVSNGDGTTARLLIDFFPEARIEEWHFQYLKAAAHLFSLVRQLEEPEAAAREADADHDQPPLPPAALPAGWHRVVVRYLDGAMLKGYGQEFTASSPALHVWPSLDAPPGERVMVPLGHLKAVFFVRDFDGNPAGGDRPAGGSSAHGRRVEVTFLDGEMIVGTTLNYSAHAAGFFIRPVDAGGNNLRIFAAARAIRQVRFP